MTALKKEDELHKIVGKVLENYAAVQINLLSTAARTELTKAIVEEIRSKFYTVAFASQEIFE
ncbi:hypothetical protein CMO96_04400 [Candidatus Woesebacteria bacterium]|nr:hypothetical protein [Candidatus Woesebacteria bacterium]|tara:strand:+ start:280 stop:465 length:186 start_codon:yes stop_codon:yes gene_type:complete